MYWLGASMFTIPDILLGSALIRQHDLEMLLVSFRTHIFLRSVLSQQIGFLIKYVLCSVAHHVVAHWIENTSMSSMRHKLPTRPVKIALIHF